ncbi:AbrB/MazE/SpoVT family DNA-binding domain-containing protein [Promineifilum sp.]|uniref:AbrB/MazE/SpoVT family DNA-binding domain-containing protein n=1 Tax=Promineifilum sp. TaxID=2664178 RepID=UPI0035AE5D98
MTIVSISPKYQIVIPKSIREALKLQPGQKVQVIQYEGRIELIPVLPIQSMRGFLKGIDTTIEREADRV